MTDHEQGEQGVQGEPGETGAAGARGERGPSGDPGEQGTSGVQGLTGVIGPIGIIGERGRTGDQGQHGQPGEPGKTGATGATGAQGRNLKPMLAVIFAFIVSAALILSWIDDRHDAQQDANDREQFAEIRENTEQIGNVLDTARYEGCLGGVATVEAYNARLLVLADIERRRMERESDPVERGLLQEEITSYETGVLPVPDCESLKP